jgi:integrase/recombinase XerD
MAATPLSNGAEEYLSWLEVERGRARNTVRSYRRDLASYESRLSARRRTPVDARPEDVEAYVGSLRDSGVSPASVAHAVSVVRGFHRFLVDEGMAAGDPTSDLEAVTLPRRLPKALTEEEVTTLLGAVVGDDPRTRRDRALVEVLYATGGRISEVVGLDLADLATGEGLVRLYGKGSKERLVPLGRYAEEALASWLAPEGRGRMAPKRWRRRGDAEAVFLNARGGRLGRQGAFGILRGRARAAGLGDRVSPHVLRHSCATHMLAHGADVRVVQELLGHASVTTTQLYTKVTTEHLRSAYEAAHPRATGSLGSRAQSTRARSRTA